MVFLSKHPPQVPSIANWRLSGVSHGGLRLTIKILLALGCVYLHSDLLFRRSQILRYQVRVGVLQAGHYGTPQRRRRFILLAANAASSLPEFPHPTSSFAASRSLKLSAFPKVDVPWQFEGYGDDDESDDGTKLPPCIPHSIVSIQAAISDLHSTLR